MSELELLSILARIENNPESRFVYATSLRTMSDRQVSAFVGQFVGHIKRALARKQTLIDVLSEEELDALPESQLESLLAKLEKNANKQFQYRGTE